MRPETRFARLDDQYLAYQVVGEGDRVIVVVSGGPTHVEGIWDVPERAALLEQLCRLGRVVLFDHRGVGLSDRPAQPRTLESSADDVLQVMDTAGIGTAVLFGMVDGASTALVTAALHPDRVQAVVAVEPIPSFVPGGEPPWGFPHELAGMVRALVTEHWGAGATQSFASGVLSQDPRVVAAWQRYERMSATPSSAARWLDYLLTVDVRPYLDRVQVPVLCVHARGNGYLPVDTVRWLCDRLPDARLVELDGDLFDVLMSAGPVADEVEDFIAGTRLTATARRQMVALLVTDLVGSTSTLARIGEESWRLYLQDHRRVVRDALQRFGGTEIDTAGDGFLATFPLASSALRCAVDVRRTSRAAGVPVRQGVHAGEVTLLEPGIAGQAVHATARLASLARAGEVLVSGTALTMAGEVVPTEPAGSRLLRGLPARMPVYRVQDPGPGHAPAEGPVGSRRGPAEGAAP